MKDFVKRIFKSLVGKMAANKWKTVLWILCVIFSPVIVPVLLFLILVGVLMLYSIFDPSICASTVSRDSVSSTVYRTAKDFHKYTGVHFRIDKGKLEQLEDDQMRYWYFIYPDEELVEA